MQSARASAWKRIPHGLRIIRSSKRSFRAQRSQRSPPVQPRHGPIPDPIETLNANARASLHPSPPRRSLVGRIFRSAFYIAVFGATGFAAIWGWKTWRYLHIGQRLDLPASRLRSRAYAATKLEQSSLVQSLKKDGWVEDNPFEVFPRSQDGRNNGAAQQNHGRHLVHEQLIEGGNLVTRHFRQPTDGMTVLVFMADFACESWPNTLHGGIATTVIQEALDTHVKNFPGYTAIRHRKTSMNYRLPLNPGVVYSVLIRTDTTEFPYEASQQIDKSLMGVGANVLLNQMDRAPKYIEQYNETTKSSERVCKIHDAHKGIRAYVKGGSALFLATSKFRELVAKNQQMIPVLQEKLDTWSKSYEYIKPKSSK